MAPNTTMTKHRLVSRFQTFIARLLENELIRRILKNAGYLFGATGVTSAMGFLQSILAGRLLGPSTFGILGSLTSFTSVVNRFASFRMDELVVRYVGHYQENDDPQRAAAVFKIAGLMEICSSVVAFGLIFALAPLGSRFFAHDTSLTFWFQIYGSIVLANGIYESATGLLQILDRFRIMAIINVVQSVITLSLVVIAFFAKSGLNAVVIAYMSGKTLGSLAISFFALVEARRTWGANWWHTPLSLLKSEIRSLLTFAFSTNLSSTISLISKDSEVLWVSAFLGTQPAGYYLTALKLTGLIQLPVSPLPKATFPELAREIARKNWENVRYILRQGSRLAAIYSVPVTLVLMVLGRWLIGVTYGPEFIPTYEPLVILLVGYTFVNIFYWNRVALLSLARPVFPTLVNFSGMVLKLACIFLFVPRWGYLAFAVLLSGYYIFTVGIAAARVYLDLRSRTARSTVA
jgi:O-antigen/teichoic acid export membrane protein